MKTKTVKITEAKLRDIVSESILEWAKNGLFEDEYNKPIDDDYYGGGLPEKKPRANKYTYENEVTKIYKAMKPYIDKLAGIFNNSECEDRAVYDKIMDALNILDELPMIGKKFYSIEIDEL